MAEILIAQGSLAEFGSYGKHNAQNPMAAATESKVGITP